MPSTSTTKSVLLKSVISDSNPPAFKNKSFVYFLISLPKSSISVFEKLTKSPAFSSNVSLTYFITFGSNNIAANRVASFSPPK